MKSSIIALGAVTLLLTSAVSVDELASFEQSSLDDAYACVWFPLCDKEIYSPIVPPKDPNTETQDAKDEKVA